MKKTLAGLTAVLIGGALSLATVLPASAHTHGWEAECETGVIIDLSNYHPIIPGEDAVPAVEGTPAVPGAHHDAVGEPTISNPDYVPAQDAVPTTYVQEFEYVQKITGHIQWHEEGWNPGKGWTATGNHRDSTTVLVQGHDAIPAQGEETIPNPDYIAAYDDPGTPATPGTPGKDAVDPQANHITLTGDGDTLIDTDFGSSFHQTIPTADKTQDHTYHLVVTSLDGIGAIDEVKTTEACEVVTPPAPGPANPHATIQVTCGDAEIGIENPGENILTASFIVYTDGQFDGAYALAAGEHQKIEKHFAEDSGDHVIEVRTGPAQGDESLAKATVTSDCKPAVVTPPTDNPTPPVKPAPPAAPAAPAAPVVAAAPAQADTQLVTDDVLAHTGNTISPLALPLALLGGLIGGLLTIADRRRRKLLQ